MNSSLNNLPLILRSNDVERHIINIDSRFRDNVAGSSSSAFYFTLPVPIRNVLRLRLTSIEIPNNYYFFSDRKNNVSLLITYTHAGNTIQVPIFVTNGNYAALDMASEITSLIQAQPNLSAMTCTFNQNTGHFTFSWTSPFTIDTTYGSISRPFDYGLGYYIGFTYGVFPALASDGSYAVESNILANFSGDSYILMKLNDWYCINHSFYGNTIKAFAKLLLKIGKNFMEFDDYGGDHIKEIIFPGAQDVSRFKIELLDSYGVPLDMTTTNFSMSIEVLEIKNLNLYNALRDSLAMRWVGSGNFSQGPLA